MQGAKSFVMEPVITPKKKMLLYFANTAVLILHFKLKRHFLLILASNGIKQSLNPKLQVCLYRNDKFHTVAI